MDDVSLDSQLKKRYGGGLFDDSDEELEEEKTIVTPKNVQKSTQENDKTMKTASPASLDSIPLDQQDEPKLPTTGNLSSVASTPVASTQSDSSSKLFQESTKPVVALKSGSTNKYPPVHSNDPAILTLNLTVENQTENAERHPVLPMKTDMETFDIESKLQIALTGFEKRGDGMQSFVVYKVVTKPVHSGGPSMGFIKQEYDVWRRFSDFLGLHDKLIEKHLPNGVVIPPAPDKDIFGTTKTKISKTTEDDLGPSEFLEKRRAALERFLRRCSLHPSILLDPDYRDFLTYEGDLPKSTQTSALSAASVMKLLNKMGDSITKMTIHLDDSDTWFNEKQLEIDDLERHFRNLHNAVELLITQRKELSLSIDSFCKNLSLLAACEDHTALSKTLSALSETFEKISVTQQDQADHDFFLFSEIVRDYLGVIMSVKEVFQERVKAWQTWQTAQLNLTKKRENKTRHELAGRSDRLPAAKREVQEYESKVQECEEHFEKLTKIIRKEVCRFDAHRVHDFKQMLVVYLESLAKTQQILIKHWESFLIEAKAMTC